MSTKNLPALPGSNTGTFASHFSELARQNPTAATAVAQMFRDKAMKNPQVGLRAFTSEEGISTAISTLGSAAGGALTAFFDKREALARDAFDAWVSDKGASITIGEETYPIDTKEGLDKLFAASFSVEAVNTSIKDWVALDANKDQFVAYPGVGWSQKTGVLGGKIPYAFLIALGARLAPHILEAEPGSISDERTLNYLDAGGQGIWDGFVGAWTYRYMMHRGTEIAVSKASTEE